jgi:hypothetical protein
MLTRPIPLSAMPIVAVLRRDVRRPSARTLRPVNVTGDVPAEPCLRWVDPEKGTICPLGRHPKATKPDPDSSPDEAPWLTTAIYGSSVRLLSVSDSGLEDDVADACLDFMEWWDAQTDAKAAVEAVWPRKRARARAK